MRSKQVSRLPLAHPRRKNREEHIRALRDRAASSDREKQPVDFARLARELADLYAEDGNRTEAVLWYGRGIDAYLYAGMADAAIAMCRKLLRFEPRAIRVRSTLAILHVARGDYVEAAEEVRAYVDASRERGARLETSRTRLRRIAELVEDPAFLTLLGECLGELGDPVGGMQVARVGRADPLGGRKVLSAPERWRLLLSAALEPPQADQPAGAGNLPPED